MKPLKKNADYRPNTHVTQTETQSACWESPQSKCHREI